MLSSPHGKWSALLLFKDLVCQRSRLSLLLTQLSSFLHLMNYWGKIHITWNQPSFRQQFSGTWVQFLMLYNHHSCLVPRHFHHSSNEAIKHFLLTHHRPHSHQAAFRLSAFISSGRFLQMELCNSIYGMSTSVMFLMFSCVVSPSVLFTGECILLCSSLCVYLWMHLSIAICSAIHPLVSIWVVVTFWLMLAVLLWTVRDFHLFKYMF